MNDGGTLTPELALLSGSNLRNGSGANSDPSTYAQFRSWLLNATATNMAYMLSAQTGGDGVKRRGGIRKRGLPHPLPRCHERQRERFRERERDPVGGEYGAWCPWINDFGKPYRSYQEALKNCLDDANNKQELRAVGS
jgi:hypothetical protein